MIRLDFVGECATTRKLREVMELVALRFKALLTQSMLVKLPEKFILSMYRNKVHSFHNLSIYTT